MELFVVTSIEDAGHDQRLVSHLARYHPLPLMQTHHDENGVRLLAASKGDRQKHGLASTA